VGKRVQLGVQRERSRPGEERWASCRGYRSQCVAELTVQLTGARRAGWGEGSDERGSQGDSRAEPLGPRMPG